MSKSHKKQKACQIAIPTKFILYNGKPGSKDYRKFSMLNEEITGIIEKIQIPFMSVPRVTGEYDQSSHLFYVIPYKYAEEIKKKIIDAGLAEKVHTNEFWILRNFYKPNFVLIDIQWAKARR